MLTRIEFSFKKFLILKLGYFTIKTDNKCPHEVTVILLLLLNISVYMNKSI